MDPPPRRLRLVPKVTFILSSIAIHYEVVKFVYNNHTPHDLLNPSLLFVLPCTIFIISHGLGVLRHHAFAIALRREFGVISLWLFYFLPVLIQIVLWLRLAQWVTATVPWLIISAFRLSPIVILLFLAVQLWRRTSRQTQQFPAREHRLVAQRVDELADGPIHPFCWIGLLGRGAISKARFSYGLPVVVDGENQTTVDLGVDFARRLETQSRTSSGDGPAVGNPRRNYVLRI
ncbi:uncharacterized protein CCOS01_11513 [Colletotrichum costaricense]|uniref:Transmembrane protein n=1 Tax=Colletotrichum costaricense TaxID=1209916 RepID=A0AAI9YQ19_9PEZI|nr:uncharacterized protein CCOS01_11513 [Colletotrichum costaricense]KAK1518693.1 hypothetical protein CCOS01_11513 [Colletotrichum costaricense]